MKNNKTLDLDVSDIMLSMKSINKSKNHLLTFIKTCGFNTDHREYKRLNFLIKKHSDLTEWVRLFNNDIDTIAETTDKFKNNKIKEMNIGLNEFIISTSKGLKNGLENFFQVECNDDDLRKIEKKLHSNEISLESIYNKCKEDKWYDSAWTIARSKLN